MLHSSPFEKCVECRAKRTSPLGETVLHLRGHLRIDLPLDDPVALKFAQLLDQHLLRDLGNGPLELGEPQHWVREQVEEDHHFPAAFEHPEGALDAARRHVRSDVRKLTCG